MYKLSLGIISVLSLVACGGGGGSSEDPPTQDLLPNAFSIASIENAELSTIYESETITITGVSEAVSISAEGCEFSINNESFSNNSSNINNNQTVKFRMESSSNFATETSCDIGVGQFNTTFKVTTDEAHVVVTVERKESSSLLYPQDILSLYSHDAQGGQHQMITVTGNEHKLYYSGENVSYTVYSNTDVFGSTYHNLYTEFQTVTNRTHTVYPYSGAALPDNCKTLNINAYPLSNEYAHYSLNAMNECGNVSGRVSYNGGPLTISMNSEGSEEDLLFYAVDSDQNIAGYRLLSSNDYTDNQTINLDYYDNAFTPVSFSVETNHNGKIQINGYQNGDYAFPLGIHNFSSNQNSGVLNTVPKMFSEYQIVTSNFANSQYISETRMTDTLSSTIEEDFNGLGYTSVSISERTISWEMNDNINYDEVRLKISASHGEEKFNWEISGPASGSIVIPEVLNFDVESFLSNANMSVRLKHENPQNGHYRFAIALGSLSCSNGNCTIDFQF